MFSKTIIVCLFNNCYYKCCCIIYNRISIIFSPSISLLFQCHNGWWGSWKVHFNWHITWSTKKGTTHFFIFYFYFFLEFITFLYILLLLTSRFNAVDLSCAWLFPLLQLKQNQCLLSSKPGFLLRLRVKLDSALACFGFCCHVSDYNKHSS